MTEEFKIEEDLLCRAGCDCQRQKQWTQWDGPKGDKYYTIRTANIEIAKQLVACSTDEDSGTRGAIAENTCQRVKTKLV